MINLFQKVFLSFAFLLLICSAESQKTSVVNANKTETFYDKPFLQDYSIKYTPAETGVTLSRVYCDRNGVIKVLSSKGLLHPFSGEMLYPGTLVKDETYLPLNSRKINSVGLYAHEFVFLDDRAVFSDAWSGKLYANHSLPEASHFAGGKNFDFLISDGAGLAYLKQSGLIWDKKLSEKILDIIFDSLSNNFFILSPGGIHSFSPSEKSYTKIFSADSLTCFTLTEKSREIIAGTPNGYLTIDLKTGKQKGVPNQKLPCNELTAVTSCNGNLWFGSRKGAFMLKPDGKFSYYASKRWLPSDEVKQIVKGDQGDILILTDKGLSKICFREMTLASKADFFEKQVRQRHIRNGFNAALSRMKEGNLGTGSMEDSDNDGLWTSMYLAAEAFRYAVTKSPEALINCRESLDAMERLYSINPVKGFPARSYERKGFPIHDIDRWRQASDTNWEWKSTTSSDEAIGHIFVFAVVAELINDQPMRKKAVGLIDSLMQHIIRNDLYMIDWDGKPTQWGKWNPDYVNARPEIVGDRKINSSNITAMLQTAYYFTRNKIYKEKAFELFNKYGYLKNLMQPMKEVGQAPADADDWSKMLSENWNHSDDEMYFLGYWGLYRYAFNDTLKKKFKAAIIDHWEIERPEKEAAWNIFTAVTGVSHFDLKESIWYLQEYPLDLIGWTVHNSDRKDIELIAPNFRTQTTKEVLPPDELRVTRHNANRFALNGGSDGRDEESAGDIWLLPYWMGRWLGVIREPVAPAKQ